MDTNIVVSTRIRLARNLVDYPFPGKLSSQGKTEVLKKVTDAVNDNKSVFDKDFNLIKIGDISETQAVSLVEKHLVSPEFISEDSGRGLLLDKDENISIMINEEDHIRLQVFEKGFDLDKAYELADKLDNTLDKELNFAYDDNLGYLTQCPTNLGTGMRASVMLHLPALQKSRVMQRIQANLNKLGLTIRGTYGEETEAKGAMYQLSNQVTLGISEKAAIENLKNIASQLVNQELKARENIVNSLEEQDRINRSLGILKSAVLMSHDEATELLSNVRLGVATGLINAVTIEQVDNLIAQIQPATLMLRYKENFAPKDRDLQRAKYLREELNK